MNDAEETYQLLESDPLSWLEQARGARLSADVIHAALTEIGCPSYFMIVSHNAPNEAMQRTAGLYLTYMLSSVISGFSDVISVRDGHFSVVGREANYLRFGPSRLHKSRVAELRIGAARERFNAYGEPDA
jgi:hypothetical protein